MTPLSTSAFTSEPASRGTEHGVACRPLMYVPTAVPPSWTASEAIREHFRVIVSSILRAEHSCIGICSTAAGEGTSWVSGGVAMAVAEARRDVIVVDAQRLRPSQVSQFEATAPSAAGRPATGAEQSILARITIADATRSPGGATPADLASLLAMWRGPRVVLVDLEPIRESSQVIGLGGALDAIVLVVEAERERREVVSRSVEALARAGHIVSGAVLNKRVRHVPDFIYRWL